MSILLESTNLCKVYSIKHSKPYNALKNINLKIKRGDFVTLMGPSGSGKSSLLYNLSGMDKMTSGSVLFDGQDISCLSEKQLARLRLKKMGFIFQQIHLLKSLSLVDNIIFSAYKAKQYSFHEIKKRALILMEQMGIAEIANNDINQASGGQLQRVAICRSIINDPEIIFGDEPTGALNSKAANDILAILATINQDGTTILLATHDIKVSARSERVIFIRDGEIVDEMILGKYDLNSNEDKVREQELSRWLFELNL